MDSEQAPDVATPVNLAAAPTMLAALHESFADKQAITAVEDRREGRGARDAWQLGQTRYEHHLDRPWGDAA